MAMELVELFYLNVIIISSFLKTLYYTHTWSTYDMDFIVDSKV